MVVNIWWPYFGTLICAIHLLRSKVKSNLGRRIGYGTINKRY